MALSSRSLPSCRPLEAKRALFRMARMNGSIGDDSRGRVKLLLVDAKKARLNGKLAPDEFAFVFLPLEAGGAVCRLRRWLYGMRAAASAWEDYAANLEPIGFRRGLAAPTVF